MIDPDAGGYSVIPDFREPDNIRLGITPLYTSFEEIFRAVKLVEEITKSGLYQNYSSERNIVT